MLELNFMLCYDSFPKFPNLQFKSYARWPYVGGDSWKEEARMAHVWRTKGCEKWTRGAELIRRSQEKGLKREVTGNPPGDTNCGWSLWKIEMATRFLTVPIINRICILKERVTRKPEGLRLYVILIGINKRKQREWMGRYYEGKIWWLGWEIHKESKILSELLLQNDWEEYMIIWKRLLERERSKPLLERGKFLFPIIFKTLYCDINDISLKCTT